MKWYHSDTFIIFAASVLLFAGIVMLIVLDPWASFGELLLSVLAIPCLVFGGFPYVFGIFIDPVGPKVMWKALIQFLAIGILLGLWIVGTCDLLTHPSQPGMIYTFLFGIWLRTIFAYDKSLGGNIVGYYWRENA